MIDDKFGAQLVLLYWALTISSVELDKICFVKLLYLYS